MTAVIHKDTTLTTCKHCYINICCDWSFDSIDIVDLLQLSDKILAISGICIGRKISAMTKKSIENGYDIDLQVSDFFNLYSRVP